MKPILFSAEMVRAIQDLRKTQTRRVIKPQPPQFVDYFEKRGDGFKAYMVPGEPCDYPLVKPKYQPGDILWVRETWFENEECLLYKASKYENTKEYHGRNGWVQIKWRPSIFMPREAARIFLLVTNVRAERVQDITEEDAIAEGVLWERARKINQLETSDSIYDNAKALFMRLWDSINAKRGYGWDKNPWVWVYEFERISKEEAKRLEGMK